MKPLLKKTKVEKVNTEICKPSLPVHFKLSGWQVRSANYLKAFTIIELLFVITIIALLFGGGIGGYLGLQKRTAVDQAAMNLKKDIEYMKHAALLNRSDSNDQRWVSAFAIRIYKDGEVYKYRKYKYCSASTGFESFIDRSSFNGSYFDDTTTVCTQSNKFVFFEKNEDNIIDRRVGIMGSELGSYQVGLIIFETITGEITFYRQSSSSYYKVSTGSSVEIKMCSVDNRAKRSIIINRDSRVQFNYGAVDDCTTTLGGGITSIPLVPWNSEPVILDPIIPNPKNPAPINPDPINPY